MIQIANLLLGGGILLTAYSGLAMLNLFFSSVQFSRSVVSDSLQPHESQHTRPPCPSTPRVYSNSCPLSRWCHPNICCPLLLPSSISPSIRVFSNELVLCIRWPNIGVSVSASASALPMNIQDWFPWGWIGWISLQSKGTLKSLLQHHSSKASILRRSAFFTVQFSSKEVPGQRGFLGHWKHSVYCCNDGYVLLYVFPVSSLCTFIYGWW